MGSLNATFLLAAGLGTRLRPLTDLVPKALVPLGDVPLAAHALRAMAPLGAERRVANAFHHGAALEEGLVALDPGLRVAQERELLGTAGGLAHAEALLGEGDVVVWNCDAYGDIDALAVRAAWERRDGAEALLVVVPAAEGERGAVGLGPGGEVVRLRESAVAEEVGSAHFTGVHVVGAELREALPPRGCLVGDVYIPALRLGARLATLVHRGAFLDVGTLRGYLEAHRRWLEGRGLSSYRGPGAHVAIGIACERAVVGAGARVLGAGELRDVVVWPGATATAPLTRAVVAQAGTLVRLDAPAG